MVLLLVGIDYFKFDIAFLKTHICHLFELGHNVLAGVIADIAEKIVWLKSTKPTSLTLNRQAFAG